MPLYEYVCKADGETVTLLRPMRDADKPVDDPDGRGRTFVRAHSTFQVNTSPKPAADPPAAGGCACGNPYGPCGG